MVLNRSIDKSISPIHCIKHNHTFPDIDNIFLIERIVLINK